MHNISVIKSDNTAVFQRLNRLSDPPRQIFVRGEYDPSVPTIAVVGSRKHSPYGRAVATQLAGQLARRGITVVSGLALGIDSVAHTAVLEQKGTTLAVMPGGVDRVYPASHRQLAESIVAGGGALVSEYAPGSLPAKHHFVARNRIVAALSDAVLVIEAAAKSGTLITAEYGLDIGIPILAVPGPITSPTSVGTNRLIDLGAKLVATVDDILTEIGLTWDEAPEVVMASTRLGRAIVECLRDGPLKSQEIAELVKLDMAELNRELTHLELEAAIVNLGNNTWSLKPDLHAGN